MDKKFESPVLLVEKNPNHAFENWETASVANLARQAVLHIHVIEEAAKAVLDAADLAQERDQRIEPTKMRLAIGLLRAAMDEKENSTRA